MRPVPRQFSRSDLVITIVLTLATAVAGTIIGEVLLKQASAIHGGPRELSYFAAFLVGHRVRINVLVSVFAVVMYALIAGKTTGRDRVVFALWTSAWVMQIAGVIYRHVLERPVPAGLEVHTILNAMSTSLLLFGAFVLRSRLGWPLVLVPLPIVAGIFDSVTSSVPLAFANFAVLLYFALAILERFRADTWVPAYFAFYCYALYGAAQVLYPIDRHFEHLVIVTPGLAASLHAKEAVQLMGYVIGASTKLGGAVAMLLVYMGMHAKRGSTRGQGRRGLGPPPL